MQTGYRYGDSCPYDRHLIKILKENLATNLLVKIRIPLKKAQRHQADFFGVYGLHLSETRIKFLVIKTYFIFIFLFLILLLLFLLLFAFMSFSFRLFFSYR